METVVLKGEDFKTIHNTLWAMQYKGMDAVTAAETIREALKDAYDQDSAKFDSKHEHYESVRDYLGLRSIWSIYSVEDLNQPHPYAGAAEVCYRDHWGDEPVYETIMGPTWADLYSAADRCIQRSGDGSSHLY